MWIFTVNNLGIQSHRKQTCLISQEILYGKNVTDFEKKKMLPLTKEELKSHQDAKVCYICGKKILKKLCKSKDYGKVRVHGHYTDKYSG